MSDLDQLQLQQLADHLLDLDSGSGEGLLLKRIAARIAALEADADMVDEREMRSNLRIEALEAAGNRLAEAVDACLAFDEDDLDSEDHLDASAEVRVALAAWRAIEKEGGDE